MPQLLSVCLLSLIILFSHIPLSAAQNGCGVTCSNYLLALSNTAALYDQNVYYTGPISQKAVLNMCTASDPIACFKCGGTGVNPGAQQTLLERWAVMCTTFNSAGGSAAVNCWDSNFVPANCIYPAGASPTQATTANSSPIATLTSASTLANSNAISSTSFATLAAGTSTAVHGSTLTTTSIGQGTAATASTQPTVTATVTKTSGGSAGNDRGSWLMNGFVMLALVFF